MLKKIFITGISTDVGKSIVAAIVTEAMEADYWKPVQAGELENCDSQKITDLFGVSKDLSKKEKLKKSRHVHLLNL